MKNFIFALLLFLPVSAAAQNNPPVVVELFSSQGCPACPPADEHLGVLAKAPNVIALSCHVDYFPVLGDGLGKKFCTDRQAKYIAQIGRKKYYTPQMMVNGHMDVIGYETQEIAQKIQKARTERANLITIQPRGEGVYNFSLPRRELSRTADLWMVMYDRPRHFKNRGKTTTYHNVVSHMIPLGKWGGTIVNRAVFPITNPKTAGFAIIAQDKNTGHVLAAGDYKL